MNVMRVLVQRFSLFNVIENNWISQNVSKYNFCTANASISKNAEREVPAHIRKPEYFYKFMKPGDTLGEPEIKNSEQIHRMRASGQLAAKILKGCGNLIKIGTTTNDIDAFVHEETISNGAYPSPLRYAGYPKSVCTSVNEVACHGIPNDIPLKDGDILNVDVTVYFNGYHGDCSRTFLVGNVDERSRYLVENTEECLRQCIELCAPNVPFKEIGRFITIFCREKNLGVIPAFIGHGIGSYFHGPPEIIHYKNNFPGEMKAGMTFTIEPILTLGGPEIQILEDGWTAVSADGERSAQFEHTVLITEQAAEVLTVADSL